MSMILTAENISEYIAALRSSGVAGKNQRRVRLMQYLLCEELNGRGDVLKAYSIALDVFERPDDFDPTTESIVRVEIGRLRAAIAAFEESAFASTAIKVEIPTGSYRPNVSKR